MHTVTINDIDVPEDNMIEAENKTDDLGKEEQKSKFILLRAKGNSYARIAKQIGVSKGTLVNPALVNMISIFNEDQEFRGQNIISQRCELYWDS
jgi:hypothetical protein